MSPFVDQLEREVSATPDEFARGLRTAFPGQVEGGPLAFHVTALGAAMHVTLTETPPRHIASLLLPTLHVRIRFDAGNADEQRALIDYLDRATQRGGG